MTLSLNDLALLSAELCSPKPNMYSQFTPCADHDLEALRSALACIPADTPRGDGSIHGPDGEPAEGFWLGVVLAARRDGGEAAKSIVREWSSTSDRFTDEGFELAWAQFDPDHSNPVTMKSVYRLAVSFGWKPAPRATRYKLLDRAAMMDLKPIEWRVKGIFPREGIGAIFGPSGSGKSFLALDLGIRVARGDDWFGRKTHACPVTYVMLEGEAGLRNRIVAWEAATGHNIPIDFTGVPQGFAFAEQQDVEDLAAALPSGGVVIIDTLNRAAPGKDENSSKDMGEVLAGMKKLQQITGGLVLTVHHTGKDASKGMRGHSSLHAALDGAIEVKRDKDGRQWSAAKVKDGSDDIAVPFRLKIVDLGFDQDGEPITSCVAAPDAEAMTRPREPKGKNQLLAWQALKMASPSGLTHDEAVAKIASLLSGTQKHRQRSRASEILQGLLGGNFVQLSDDRYRIG